MPKKISVPAYRLHKASGQACVRLDGKDHYLGRYGTRESRDLYDELVAKWLLKQDPNHVRLAIDDLCLLYLDYAATQQTPHELNCMRGVLRLLIQFAGRTRAGEFGPRQFRQFRDWLVEQIDRRPGRDCTLSRQYINKSLGRIRQLFKWAAREELISVTVWQALGTVDGLRRGRTTARESTPVTPVAEETIQATLAYLSDTVADMVRLQRLTGCRPAEICMVRPIDLDTNGEVWLYRPESHKTAWRGKERVIAIGPRAQDVLRRYLLRAAEAYCFSPAEAEAKRRADNHEQRQTPLSCGNRPGTNRKSEPKKQPGDCYTTASYRRAITRAVQLANRKRKTEGLDPLPNWAPNQLRHSAATEICSRFGLEAAQVALGHSGADVTQIYAERDLRLAMEVARQIG